MKHFLCLSTQQQYISHEKMMIICVCAACKDKCQQQYKHKHKYKYKYKYKFNFKKKEREKPFVYVPLAKIQIFELNTGIFLAQALEST